MSSRPIEQHRLLVVPPGTPLDRAIAQALTDLGGEYEYVRGSRLDDGRRLLRFRRRQLAS